MRNSCLDAPSTAHFPLRKQFESYSARLTHPSRHAATMKFTTYSKCGIYFSSKHISFYSWFREMFSCYDGDGDTYEMMIYFRYKEKLRGTCAIQIFMFGYQIFRLQNGAYRVRTISFRPHPFNMSVVVLMVAVLHSFCFWTHATIYFTPRNFICFIFATSPSGREALWHRTGSSEWMAQNTWMQPTYLHAFQLRTFSVHLSIRILCVEKFNFMSHEREWCGVSVVVCWLQSWKNNNCVLETKCVAFRTTVTKDKAHIIWKYRLIIQKHFLLFAFGGCGHRQPHRTHTQPDCVIVILVWHMAEMAYDTQFTL